MLFGSIGGILTMWTFVVLGCLSGPERCRSQFVATRLAAAP